SIGQNESKQIFDLSSFKSPTPVYFVDLKLKDGGKQIADNFYWLSTKEDVLDNAKTEWYVTPNKDFADFTSLNKLPATQIQTEEHWTANGLNVTLKNPSPKVAFFIEFRVVNDKNGKTLLPVRWNDNYVSLLPGETKQLSAEFYDSE